MERKESLSRGLKEVRPVKKKFNKYVILYSIILFVSVIYVSVVIINQHIQIGAKEQELKALQEELQITEIKSEYLNDVKNYKGDDLDKYIEDKAREELDYINNGERVFVNVSGN